jgi:hypothetical protein
MMSNSILFSETQKFKQWWIWLILIGINGLFIYGVFTQIFGGESFGDNPMSNTGLLITTTLFLVFTLVFFNLRLETKISKDGIYVRFFPFHLKFRYFMWSDLKKTYIREYAPLMEYGGWGLRYGLFGHGTAYNVSGKIGLQLQFSDDKKLLIGTNKSEALSKVLVQIGAIKQE